MEIREAVALYAAPERQDRRADRRRAVVTRRRRAHRGPGRCVLLLSLPVAAAAAGGDPVRHAGGIAHRRDRQGGARVRGVPARGALGLPGLGDRKSTRLNSSHVRISYAVFCLKKKKKITDIIICVLHSISVHRTSL